MGKIVTFYSYKGGVGRTLALANVSVLLAQWQYKVLVVDWDLEAPGLEQYFRYFLNTREVRKRDGLIDLLSKDPASLVDSVETEWRNHKVHIQIPQAAVGLDLITAGRMDEEYSEKIGLDFRWFYKNKGDKIIEQLRDAWSKEYDYVIIDSRTGVTDIAGICTIQLPDILFLMFTPMEQSIQGTMDIYRRVQDKHRKLPFDRLRLQCVPIASRFDTEEYVMSQYWLKRVMTEMSSSYASWLDAEIYQSPRRKKEFIEITSIPYKGHFSFGERLPVLEQGTHIPGSLGNIFELIAALIANNLENTKLIFDDRADFVRKARNRSEYRHEDPGLPPTIGDDFTEKKTGIRFIWIEGGEFFMGSDNIVSHAHASPRHRVRVSPFWLAETPVTNYQYRLFIEAKELDEHVYWADPRFSAPDQPVVGVTWDEAIEFCKWLANETELGVTLPSEAQWEYAATAGEERKYPWGDSDPDDKHACYGGDRKRDGPEPVTANPECRRGPFGILCQAGGVWEWCCDAWDENIYRKREAGAVTVDPVVQEDRENGELGWRVIRGGSWDAEDAVYLRSAYRSKNGHAIRFDAFGFRVAVIPPHGK